VMGLRVTGSSAGRAVVGVRESVCATHHSRWRRVTGSVVIDPQKLIKINSKLI
jgi:hypothetical protein